MSATLLCGDSLTVLPTLGAGSVDAIVTDPPYGLGFMGKDWDHGVPGVHFWEAMLHVAKPGAHLVAFGGTRTFHRLTCAIEDAGWEIRDCLSWLYGSGFPKSHNGPWGGTALKPAWEPIILARKPLVGTVAANVEAHGTGALDVDGCRIEGGGKKAGAGNHKAYNLGGTNHRGFHDGPDNREEFDRSSGRWPANVCLDEDAAAALDAQSGEGRARGNRTPTKYSGASLFGSGRPGECPTDPGDTGGASRFFYCAKASRAEREAGLEGRERRPSYMVENGSKTAGAANGVRYERRTVNANHHPTVKPVALMRWLCRLVTPPGGLILDPFTGSGSTGVAAALEGFRFLGIEREAEYVAIAEARIAHARQQPMLWDPL